MENELIKLLKQETLSLKEQYILMTKDWSIKDYERFETQSTYTEEKWCEILFIEPELKNKGTSIEYKGFPRGFYNKKESKTFLNIRKKISNVLEMGQALYTKKCIKDAENHYEDSIKKLAYRIEKKELNQEKLQVKTAHIGVNINTILTDGNKTVKAFTVIASGEIQRPHYRYLIK